MNPIKPIGVKVYDSWGSIIKKEPETKITITNPFDEIRNARPIRSTERAVRVIPWRKPW